MLLIEDHTDRSIRIAGIFPSTLVLKARCPLRSGTLRSLRHCKWRIAHCYQPFHDHQTYWLAQMRSTCQDFGRLQLHRKHSSRTRQPAEDDVLVSLASWFRWNLLHHEFLFLLHLTGQTKLTGCGMLFVYRALNSNKFSGGIPASLGLLSKLFWLDLADNQLTGPVPISTATTPGLNLLTGTKHL